MKLDIDIDTRPEELREETYREMRSGAFAMVEKANNGVVDDPLAVAVAPRMFGVFLSQQQPSAPPLALFQDEEDAEMFREGFCGADAEVIPCSTLSLYINR